MNVVICFSPDWAQYVAVEAYALFKNSPPLDLYLVSDGLMGGFTHIQDHFPGHRVIYVDAQRLFERRIRTSLNISTIYTRYALYRLLLPELIKDDEILYLDADLVVNGDISELLATEFDLIAGVEDTGERYYNLKPGLGIDVYINGGVLLMDLEKIRHEKIYEQWLYHVNEKKYTFGEQCIINKTCERRIKLLDNKWNVSLSTGMEVTDKRIVHFAGSKPWNDPHVHNYDVWKRWSEEYRGVFK